MLDQGKNDPEAAAAARRLEEKLNDHQEFRMAVEDSFFISTGQNFFADEARQRLAANPYLQLQNEENTFIQVTPPFDHQEDPMPYEISQTGNRIIDIKSRADEFDRTGATKILKELAEHVKGKKGVLKLMHTNDPARKMTFERKSWYQFYELRGSKMENTSVYLKGLFREALEGCNPADSEKLLSDLNIYLQEHDNRFEAKDLGSFITRMEALQSQPGAGMKSYAWSDPDIKKLQTKEEIDPWAHWGQPKGGIDTERMVYKKAIGESGLAKVFLVNVPLITPGHAHPRHFERVVKSEDFINYHLVSAPSGGPNPKGFPAMRQGDLAASRLKSGKGLVRPEYYYVKVKAHADDDAPISYRISTQAMKKFVRDLAEINPDAQIGIYATLMPRAKGREVWQIIGTQKFAVQGHLKNIAIGTYKILNKLHQNGFAHNDIKPDNMFYDEESLEVSLIDTGMLQKHSKGGKPDYVKSGQMAGTPGYIAPQILRGQETGPETDYYAFACTLLVATEPKMHNVLTNIYDHEASSGAPILLDREPKDYLQIIVEQAKNSRFAHAAGVELEQKLTENPEFKNAIVDSFIVSSGREPDATAARRRLTFNPYLNPSLQDKDKPYELPFNGGQNINIKDRIDNVDSQDARNILTELRARVAGKEGVLTLKHATDPEQPMTIELTNWHQRHERKGPAMETTAVLLKGLFSRSLEGCDQRDKEALLEDIDAYLAGRNNQFGSKSFVAFVEKLEALRLEIVEPAPNIVEQAPSRTMIDRKKIDIDRQNEHDKPSSSLIVENVEESEIDEQYEIVGQASSSIEIVEEAEIVELAPLTAGKYGRELVSARQRVPWEYGSIQIESTLREDSQATSYLVKVPIAPSHSTPHLNRVIKVEKNVRVYPINSPDAAQDIMRRGDFAASRFKNERNILRPEEYYIAIKENSDTDPITYWRVTARELEGFVRDKAQENPAAQIGIYATVMPRARGTALEYVGDHFSSPQEVTGVTRQVAQGVYQTMTDLHQRGLAHNDLKRDNIVYDEETGSVTLNDTGLMHEYPMIDDELQQSTLRRGTTGYMSPRVAQREPHGPETDYYSFACLLLTTTEPDFERVLSRIYAQEYAGEGKVESVEPEAVLKDMSSGLYLGIMLEQGKRDPETREATERLEKKLRENPDFQQAVEDAFVISGNRQPFADKARQRLAANPYLRDPNEHV